MVFIACHEEDKTGVCYWKLFMKFFYISDPENVLTLLYRVRNVYNNISVIFSYNYTRHLLTILI